MIVGLGLEKHLEIQIQRAWQWDQKKEGVKQKFSEQTLPKSLDTW